MFKLNINRVSKPDTDLKDLKEVKEVEKNNTITIDDIKEELKEIKKDYLSDINKDLINNNIKKNNNLKYNKYKKNDILINKNIFNTALNNLVSINLTAIENRIESESSKIDLSLILQANDKEFKPLLTQYCNKTGKELHKVDVEHLKMLLAVHSKERSLELLQLDACSNYSPLWLHTEPKILNKLMFLDPCGFFIYAASHIFHSDIIKKSNLSTKPPMSQAGKESTEDKNLLDFLQDFPTQDKPADFFTNDIPESTSVRYFNLQDKIIGYRNLSLYHEESKLVEVNELLRRFLGLANPEKVSNLIKFKNTFLHEITEDFESLDIFIEELKQAIKLLFEKHFNSVRKKKIELIKINMQNNKINSNNISEIKNKYSGLSNFHKQPNIRNQNNKESILFDLKGFWDKEIERDDLLKDFAGRGNSSKFNPNEKGLDCLTGEPLNRFKKPQGKFSLNKVNKI